MNSHVPLQTSHFVTEIISSFRVELAFAHELACTLSLSRARSQQPRFCDACNADSRAHGDAYKTVSTYISQRCSKTGRQTKYNNGIRTVFHFVSEIPIRQSKLPLLRVRRRVSSLDDYSLQVTNNFVRKMKLGSVKRANRYCNIDVSSLTEGAHGGAGVFYNRGVGWAAWQSLAGRVGETKQGTPSAHRSATVCTCVRACSSLCAWYEQQRGRDSPRVAPACTERIC